MVELRGVEPLAGLGMLRNVRFFWACGCIPKNESPQFAPHDLSIRSHFFVCFRCRDLTCFSAFVNPDTLNVDVLT